MRLGVFGGTFDPIHFGHLRIAETAREAMALDKVLIVPVGTPVHRLDAPHASAEARYEMCSIAAAGNAGLEMSRLETDAPGPCYTVDTLERLRQERPDAELRLIIGADEAVAFPTWHEPRAIVRQARLCVATRPGLDTDAIRARLPEWVLDATDFLPPMAIDISATAIRSRLAAGQTVRYLLPDGVIRYIEQQGLYRR